VAPTASSQVAVVSLWSSQGKAKPLGCFPICFFLLHASTLSGTDVLRGWAVAGSTRKMYGDRSQRELGAVGT